MQALYIEVNLIPLSYNSLLITFFPFLFPFDPSDTCYKKDNQKENLYPIFIPLKVCTSFTPLYVQALSHDSGQQTLYRLSNKSTENIYKKSFAMRTKFLSIFDHYIATAFGRQLLLAEYLQVKEEPSINQEKGSVEFSNGQKYDIELLGTQLEDSTFLWAWAPENDTLFTDSDFSAPFPSALIQTALQLKQWGQEQAIEVLTHPKIVLELSAVPLVPDEFNADHIACLAAGLQNKVYWRDTKDEGTVYYLIRNTPDELKAPFTAPHMLNTIEQVTSYFETDNKIMVESFLKQQNFTFSWSQKKEPDEDLLLICTAHRDEEEIIATFDEDENLIELEAHGFDGEEDYQNMPEEDFDDFLLGTWHEDQSKSNHDDGDTEFPPRIKPY